MYRRVRHSWAHLSWYLQPVEPEKRALLTVCFCMYICVETQLKVPQWKKKTLYGLAKFLPHVGGLWKIKKSDFSVLKKETRWRRNRLDDTCHRKQPAVSSTVTFGGRDGRVFTNEPHQLHVWKIPNDSRVERSTCDGAVDHMA